MKMTLMYSVKHVLCIYTHKYMLEVKKHKLANVNQFNSQNLALLGF